jgi:hypothetical protein
MALVLADLDIRQQLTFRRFLLKGKESKEEIGSVTYSWSEGVVTLI